ncbi:hypothetical protein EU546_07510, partial [Candidatus Thorarchaeota archaeon]
PFVTDCWLDSGMAHTASVHYLDDQSLFNELFPYDFITEAVDQSRGWFYSLLYTAVVMHGESPFKACVSQGHVLDEDGGKMSKSKGNVVWMADAFEAVGADPYRIFVLSRAAPWTRMNYSRKEIELTQKNLDILWNVVLFAETYMELDEFVFDEGRMRKSLDEAELEDRWLLSRVQSVTKTFHQQMENYLYHHAARALLEFMSEDLSRVYLPLVKKRVWLDSDNPKKVMAYDVLYFALKTLTELLNPLTPFLSEKIHKDFLVRFGEGLPESVNMADMPSVDEALLDSEMEATFAVLQELRSAASHARNKKGVKLRHPVARVMLVPDSEETAARARSLKDLLLDDLNTRDFEVVESDVMEDFVQLSMKPNYKALGPRLKDKMKDFVELLDTLDAEELRSDLEDGEAIVEVGNETVTLEPGDIEFEETMPEGLSSSESKIGRVFVDVTRTQDLEAEGLVRDVTRRVQVMRKELDLNVEQALDLVVEFSDDESVRLAEMFEDYLANETRADELRLVGPKSEVSWKDYDYVKDWEVDDLTLKIGMNPK